MLRVAMITDHAASGEVVDGGVQAVTKYLVDALVRLEALELHVLSFKYNIKEPRSTTERGYRRHVLPGAGMGTLTAFRKDQRTLNTMLEGIQPDIVHGQGAGHNGILACRSPFPSVITIHGIMPERNFASSAMIPWIVITEGNGLRQARMPLCPAPCP